MVPMSIPSSSGSFSVSSFQFSQVFRSQTVKFSSPVSKSERASRGI
ncbi:hypothetical protein M3J09_007630 [Ascochyta lentis]